MVDKSLQNDEKIIIDNPIGIELDFSNYPNVQIQSQEIKNSVLTGTYNRNHTIRPANIVISKMSRFCSQDGLLQYVDFKDSYISDSSFNNTAFDYGAIINCDFSGVTFNKCTFHNVSITGTDFTSARFIDCKLDHMVIESCRFKLCEFINCTTSNKLFEFCLFSETTFRSTNLQVQTIINNFGLTNSALDSCLIRNKSINEDYSILDEETLFNIEVSTELERFKLLYYLDDTIVTSGSDEFDKTFEPTSWVKTAQIPLTFTNLLSLYQEFLFDLYDKGTCCILPIIKLHSLTGTLIESQNLNKTALTAIYGIHMALASVVEEYLSLISHTARNLANPIIFLTSGPIDKNYYIDNLSPIFDDPRINIVEIRKHNSPNELFISWETIQAALPLIAIFLASRFKFEIKKLSKAASNDNVNSLVDKDTVSGCTQSLIPLDKCFQLQIGFDEKQAYLYGLKLKSIFPGDLLFELGLHISLKKVALLRKILLKILA
uniref:Pentapeptide repeat-containing protein n=1 Tax=Candidatus Kentrum sp. LFY TaxID=2126342 RepID=A0A450UL45_9GAMM|nr:MAG: Pentapeptide repeat-containing protein [Candidatus Kentron sp. LFY]